MTAWRTARCPFFCSGHVDDSVLNIHSTELGGTLGDYVVVTQTDAGPVTVTLTDVPHPELEMTPDEARLLAWQLVSAAGLADRYAFQLAFDPIERMLREVLDQREVRPE